MLCRNVAEPNLQARIHAVNAILFEKCIFSTSRESNYDQFQKLATFRGSKGYEVFLNCFMSSDWFNTFVALGFGEFDARIKDFNSLTQTAWYTVKLMTVSLLLLFSNDFMFHFFSNIVLFSLRQMKAHSMAFEFEKQCINEMARQNVRKMTSKMEGRHSLGQEYNVSIRIGHGYTYSKYNTLMHFLNVAECYWANPDLNSIQVFGKDIRTILTVSCQKIFFEQGINSTFDVIASVIL